MDRYLLAADVRPTEIRAKIEKECKTFRLRFGQDTAILSRVWNIRIEGTVRCVVMMKHMNFATNMLVTEQNFKDVHVVMASIHGHTRQLSSQLTLCRHKGMADELPRSI